MVRREGAVRQTEGAQDNQLLDWLKSNRMDMKVINGVHGARSALRKSGLLGAITKLTTRYGLCPVLMIIFMHETFQRMEIAKIRDIRNPDCQYHCRGRQPIGLCQMPVTLRQFRLVLPNLTVQLFSTDKTISCYYQENQ